MESSELLTRLKAGQGRALARCCRLLDDLAAPERAHSAAAKGLQRELYRVTVPEVWTIGITGSPGAGKSTLVDGLVAELRRARRKCCVIAVDPSSPFSGGAILGDRIRMQRHFSDPGVFIRSVATRGALGGLSRSCFDLQRVCALWGADVILLETVGVGQDELDVIAAVDTTCVVVAPGMGDDIQANKAGILEVADVLVVNKSDVPGAAKTVSELSGMLALTKMDLSLPMAHGGHGLQRSAAPRAQDPDWDVPLLSCVASRDEGVAELLTELSAHRAWLTTSEPGRSRRQERALSRAQRRLLDETLAQIISRCPDAIERLSQRLDAGKVDPEEAATELLGHANRGYGP